MDKLTVISGTLFMTADVFAIVSLAMPDWIITEVGGNFYAIHRYFRPYSILFTTLNMYMSCSSYIQLALLHNKCSITACLYCRKIYKLVPNSFLTWRA